MKFILIIVILPGTWDGGREAHAPFDTIEQCNAALERVVLDAGREGWSFCTEEHNETWYYPNKAPTAGGVDNG